MARNLKRENLKKLAGIETKNGYKVTLANYVYNPNRMYDYPVLQKVVDEDEKSRTIRQVYYFKYYDGSGEYITETHTEPKDGENTWYVVKDKAEKTLEASNRFSLKRLQELAETL